MRTIILAAALLSTATPVLAQQNCEAHSNSRAIGTVAGAGIGGVLGNAIAGRGDKTLGTIIGAVGGGVVGNQITRGSGNNRNCANAYGYYDKSGVWHANDVAASAAAGYYDRDGNWIDGAPRGYYDNQGRWIAAAGTTAQIGYRDANGRWVAPTANDFDRDNRYAVGTTPGYWQNGRWIAGPTSGSYDRNGRWQQGQAGGHRDQNGNWIADPQMGYYNQRGAWVPGTVRGRYDERGVFIAESGGYRTSAYADGTGQGYGNQGYGNQGYGNQGNGGDQRGQRDIASGLERIEARINQAASEGSLTRAEVRTAREELVLIRRYDRSLRTRNGRISPSNELRVQARLDRASDRLRRQRDNG